MTESGLFGVLKFKYLEAEMALSKGNLHEFIKYEIVKLLLLLLSVGYWIVFGFGFNDVFEDVVVKVRLGSDVLNKVSVNVWFLW